MPDITLLLTHKQILQKINRMAWQVHEAHVKAPKIVLIGIVGKGTIVCDLLAEKLREITDKEIAVDVIKIDKVAPDPDHLWLVHDTDLKGQHVVLVDDVLNSGRTMIYAAIPILQRTPKSLFTCVLANRDYKSFPVNPNFVGISLSTTRQEHITFDPSEPDNMKVFLS
ncbi:MAG: phosphoribosyltransferase [Flavobacteriales bacterium]|nr:phosphoribosyltransferase [Flavobacteriales bacterium]